MGLSREEKAAYRALSLDEKREAGFILWLMTPEERLAVGIPPARKKTQFIGPYCGAPLKKGNPRYSVDEVVTCVLPAGFRTDHFGQGRCYFHGGLSVGRYSNLKRATLREMMERHEEDENPLDLLPELHLTRALVEDYVNRYEEINDALLAWNDAELDEAAEARRKPNLVNFPDIAEVTEVLEKISRIVERVHKMNQKSPLTLETFAEFIKAAGLVVSSVVTDKDQLRKIEDGWQMITIRKA